MQRSYPEHPAATENSPAATDLAKWLIPWEPYVLSALRIGVALLFLQHGLAKLIGFPVAGPAHLTPLLRAGEVIEIVGSILLLAGLYTPVVALVMSGEMAVAYFMLRPQISFFPIANRGELEVLFCWVFFYLAVAGPGAWSLDAHRGRTRPGSKA